MMIILCNLYPKHIALEDYELVTFPDQTVAYRYAQEINKYTDFETMITLGHDLSVNYTFNIVTSDTKHNSISTGLEIKVNPFNTTPPHELVSAVSQESQQWQRNPHFENGFVVGSVLIFALCNDVLALPSAGATFADDLVAIMAAIEYFFATKVPA